MKDPKISGRLSIIGSDRPYKRPPDKPSVPSLGVRCPLTFLGDYDGRYHFLDSFGHKRDLSAAQLSKRGEIISLCRGDDAWLREMFPDRKEFDEADGKVSRVVGFRLLDATTWLIKSAAIRVCGATTLNCAALAFMPASSDCRSCMSATPC